MNLGSGRTDCIWAKLDVHMIHTITVEVPGFQGGMSACVDTLPPTRFAGLAGQGSAYDGLCGHYLATDHGDEGVRFWKGCGIPIAVLFQASGVLGKPKGYKAACTSFVQLE